MPSKTGLSRIVFTAWKAATGTWTPTKIGTVDVFTMVLWWRKKNPSLQKWRPIVNIEVPTEVKALVVSVGVSHATPGQDHSRRANYNSTPCTEQV